MQNRQIQLRSTSKRSLSTHWALSTPHSHRTSRRPCRKQLRLPRDVQSRHKTIKPPQPQARSRTPCPRTCLLQPATTSITTAAALAELGGHFQVTSGDAGGLPLHAVNETHTPLYSRWFKIWQPLCSCATEAARCRWIACLASRPWPAPAVHLPQEISNRRRSESMSSCASSNDGNAFSCGLSARGGSVNRADGGSEEFLLLKDQTETCLRVGKIIIEEDSRARAFRRINRRALETCRKPR